MMVPYGASDPIFHESMRLKGRLSVVTIRRILRWIDNDKTDPWHVYKITQVG